VQDSVLLRQEAYDTCSAQLLEEMADSPGQLNKRLEEANAEASRQLLPGGAQSFITLLRGLDGLTTSLAAEIKVEFGPRE
jgi:hypothetical protein